MRMKPRPEQPYERRINAAKPGVAIADKLKELRYGG